MIRPAIKEKAMENYRPTYAEIDLNALQYNFRQVKRRVDEKVKILVAVKANAYGHGILEVSRKLLDLDVDYLGVATTDEAIQLRKAKIIAPILLFSAILPYEIEAVIDYKITLSISSLEIARKLNRAAKIKRRKIKVHIKIDTGMGRLGIWYKEAIGFITKLTEFKNLEIEGIYTHFASADEEDSSYTFLQIRSFKTLIKDLEKRGIDIPLKHAANSMGLLRFKECHFNLVRPGLIVYGLYPHRDTRRNIRLKAVLSFKTKVVSLKKLTRGRTVSYGRTYVAPEDTVIAILPVGYGDGYSRLLSNKAEVLIRGKRVGVVGTICMDQIIVNVTPIPGVKIGDSAVLIGKQGKGIVEAEELASLSDTISYEVVSCISTRVPRIYKGVREKSV